MRLIIFFLSLFYCGGKTLISTPITGAEQTSTYLGKIKNKKVGLVVNQTSVIGNTHLVDTLKSLGVKVTSIFAPEHGFRGTADAGQKIYNSKDPSTGIPIVSLYGKKYAPDSLDLLNIDVVIFDIQDVGVRFYTFISTLHYVMESCAKNKKKLIVLDRPNPNGHYVDGPLLKKDFSSFVGVDPIPIVHGLTVGEYAKMVKGEKWIKDAESLDLTIISCGDYTHQMTYNLPIKPSPNLPNPIAIAWYPSLCLFEGTNVSVGRGTNLPFQVYGSPYFDKSKSKFNFTPEPKPGAMQPFLEGKECYGFDVRFSATKGFSLSPLLEMYKGFSDPSNFFLKNNFFDKLAGTDELKKQIIKGVSEEDIRKSWQEDLEKYKALRKKYLLYKE